MYKRARIDFPLAVVALVCIGSPGVTQEANRLYTSSAPLVTGTEDQEIAVLLENTVDIYGFSFGLSFDAEVLDVTEVLTTGTASEGADFFAGSISPTGLLGFGCIFDYFDDQRPPGTDIVKPGLDRRIAVLVVDVAERQDDTTTPLQFREVSLEPGRPVRNVLTDENGISIQAETTDSLIAVETRLPRVASIEPNSGLPGDEFVVEGEFLDESGLAVSLCDVPALFELDPDGRTLRVTAPECETVGATRLEICTNRGCVEEAEGFAYLSRAPRIDRLEDQSGREGDTFILCGEFLDQPELQVRVCGRLALVSAVENSCVSVQAPPCDELGLVDVEVCTIRGCDTATDAFFYEDPPLPPFIRGDCNGDGQVSGVVTDAIFLLNFNFNGGTPPFCSAACDADGNGAFSGVVTDAVYLLNFSFLGGFAPPAPFPACGAGGERDEALGCNLSPVPCRD